MADLITFGVAENTLDGPIEPIQLVFNELIKAKHSIIIYTELTEAKDIKELKDFLKNAFSMNLKVVRRKQITAGCYIDCRNILGFPGWKDCFYEFIEKKVIAYTVRNMQILQDVGFWETGVESSGIIVQKSPIIM